MDREEVLRKAQEENKGADVAGLSVIEKGSRLAMSAGICLIAILNLIEVIKFGPCNYAYFAIWFLMEAVLFGYKYAKLRKKHELVFTVVYSFFTVAFLVFYTLQVLGKMP